MKKLVVITAGLSRPSSTRLLADRLAAATVQAAAPATPLDVRVIELRDLAHDVMNHMLLGFPAPALENALTAVEAADGLIAVTPIFNASYSGLFKSFFDVLGDDALVDKPVLLGATGGTARHSLAIDHAMRPLFAYLRAIPMPTGVFAASEDWAGDTLRPRIDRAATELARDLTHREPPTVTDPFALTTPFATLLAT